MDESGGAVSVEVEIGGEKYTLRSNADPGQIERCARFVDESIQQVRLRAGMLDAYKSTILAALSIAAQYYEAQGSLDDLRAEMARKSAALAEDVEAELAQGGESRP